MSQSEFSRDLPYNEYQAAVGANNPSAINVFATVETLPATIGGNINLNLVPVLDNTVTDPTLIIELNFEDAYIVPIGAIDAWLGQDNNIATWDGEQWLFYIPSVGDTTTVLTGINAGYVYTFNGLVWNITLTTSPGATPFFLSGSAVDAGSNKTSAIARSGPVVLGANTGSVGSSPLTVRGTGSLENVVTRWGMGAANATTINNYFRIASFSISVNRSHTYKLLFNVTSLNGEWASCEIDIHLQKILGTGKATCRVINHAGSRELLTAGTYQIDESNFEFRRFSNAALGTATFRLYYKPTILNSSVSATVLNFGGQVTPTIQWSNTYLGVAIEAPGSGGSVGNLATYSYEGQRDNINAISNPTINDDNTVQYSYGSQWYNTTTKKVYQCVDATTGGAVWKIITLTDDDGNVVLPGGLQFSGGFATATLTANTNNLLITGLASSALVRLDSTGNFQLTGIVVPDITKAYFFSIFNIGLTGNVTFKNNDAASTAENRFLLGSDVLVQPGEGLTFIYDPVDLRWRSPGKNI